MGETFRQTVHLLMGVIGAGIILLLNDRWAFVFLSTVLVAVFLLCDAFTRGYDVPVISQVFDDTERQGKIPLMGAIAYSAGALFCLAVFGRDTLRSGSSRSGCSAASQRSSGSGSAGTSSGARSRSRNGCRGGGRVRPHPPTPVVGGGGGGGGRRGHRGILPARRQHGNPDRGVRDARGGGGYRDGTLRRGRT